MKDKKDVFFFFLHVDACNFLVLDVRRSSKSHLTIALYSKSKNFFLPLSTIEMNAPDLLTVENLLAIKHSTTSSITELPLKGRLRVVTDDEGGDPKGTVLFVDSRTRQWIHCNVDLMRPEALNATVVISYWNYIYSEVSCVQFLEFKLQDVYRLRSNENEQFCMNV
ncbi:unnamed protein product [Rhizopus stolonifer]